ncbi:nicotinate phosphoribosyltransferase [Vibrio parahaemolyticus]|uniref:nicotinate phosphoribosyltransferase n=1 Tax=Vibrio parahaemolyticus TaxID=670 RepID=UPI000AA7E252|nr:nicotinate phosphoribosyltransferase [Vibrio parahaemolyticus]EGR3229462.1 nicotinate phosphoribosyltransferase [Vibrio parahaemolyticus]EGR5928089.1 nicotinate phosphoribosyltransferase [Vibrio parahaemolyticus]EJG0180568.1 nicotinate phosphoribosyltransferase [Vibrio parahaemolyticus]MCS0114859.1 nicotinate phosphoribosyltransferase [Vibrio parahaemolyticus]
MNGQTNTQFKKEQHNSLLSNVEVNPINSAFHHRDRIITSLLDNDFYKFNMMYAIFKMHLGAKVKAKFKVRNDEDLASVMPEVKRQIEMLSHLRLDETGLNNLREKAPFYDETFFEYLSMYKLNSNHISITQTGKNNLEIEYNGSWIGYILYEIYVMAIVSECRNLYLYPNATMEQFKKPLHEKIKWLKKQRELGRIDENFHFADFGTRRRFSGKVHEYLVETLKRELPEHFVGTSNVRLASQHHLTAIGTQAHEWFQAHQNLGYQLVNSQKAALENWVQVFRGELGIALTDCISMKAFVKDFDLFFGKLFDGLRHDSGCPFKWGEMAIQAYEDLGIDPNTKTLIFSDGLDLEKAVDIYNHFKGRIKMSFGIGTFLTADMDIEGFKAMNMVMKLVETNGKPVAKLSDSPGKTMCEDEEFITYLKKVFDYKEEDLLS